jgi:uncharacterized protein (DUF2267 family)
MDLHANFEKYCNETASWVHDISLNMRAPERPDWGLKALRAVLHTIRDRTTVQEVFHLSSQLPALVRGIYFEGYKPQDKPVKMSADEFLNTVKNRLGPGVEVPPGEAVRSVLTVLYERISDGELADIRGLMPKDIQKLWDQLAPEETE